MKRMLLLTAALVSAPVIAARAGVIPVETSVSGSGPTYTWSYSGDVGTGLVANSGVANPNAGMNAAAFFTIYDFAGFVPGTCISPTGWGCSTQMTGLTPAGTLPTDNPNVVNVTWSYLFGSPLVGGAVIDGFSVMSTSNQIGTGTFAGVASRADGPLAETTVADIGSVATPTGGTPTAPGGGDTPPPPQNPPAQNPPPTNGGTGVPEPGGLALLGAALLGLGFTRRIRARKPSQA